MSEISIYDIVPTPKLADKLIGTSVGGVIEDVTYNFTLQELLQLFIPNIPANTLQGVLDYGNTATQNINLTGTITTTNLSVLTTANILNSNLSGNTRVMAGLFDRTNASGTAGQFLRSTGTQVEWFTIPTVIPTLQQVLQSGNTSNISIVLTANITAVTATADTVISNTSLNVNGVLRDGIAAVGASNQILSSTGSGVRWVDMPVYNVVSPLLYDTPTKTFSIQVASSSQSGYLSSADWINFDGKQDAIILTTSGTSGAATFVANTLNIPVYSPDLSGYVPTSRTLTINGVSYDLSANRSWTIAAGVASVTATAPLSSSGGAYPDISISQSNSSTDGYLSSVDWLDFNSKQDGLNGTGLVKSTAGVITYITDNSTNWNTAYNDSIVSAAVTGTATKTLTLNQQDGGTIQASWSDIDTGLTSVGVSMPSAFSVANSPLTSNGTIAITGAGTSLQYVDGTGALQTFPGLTGFVPYTGATTNVSLGVYSLTASSLIKSGGTSSQFLKADGSVDSSAYITLGSLSAGAPLSYNNATGAFSISQSGASTNGYLSSTDWNTFNNKQATITLTTTGSSGASTLIGNTLNIPNYANLVTSVFGRIGAVVATEGDYSLTQLSDVTITTPSNGQVLKYNGTAWVNDIDTDTGITSLNGLTALTQTFAVGTSGTDFAISSVTSTHTFNLPTASVSNRGALSSADWTTFNSKEPAITAGTTLQYYRGDKTFQTLNTTVVPEGTNLYYLDSRARAAVSLTTTGSSGASTYNSTTGVFNIPDYGAALTGYVPTSRTLNINGTSYDLSADRSWSVGTVTSVAALTIGTTGTDLSSSVATNTTTPVITLNVPTASAANRGALSSADWSTFNTKVGGVTATTPLFSSGGATPNITIQQSSGSQAGFLSSTDWTTFNNKQVAGSYITSLTGEATATGPGAAAVTLDNAAVTGKVLTGVNITGGTVLATDTMLTAFGKLQNQINGLIGSTIYQGVWNASTNTPTLTSSVGTNGYYYIVNVAGSTNLNGITDWKIGDWAIFNGGVWQKVDNTESVTSVNGFTGAVSLTTDNIAQGTTNLYFANSLARTAVSLTTTGSSGVATYNNTTGIFNIPNYGTALANYLPLTGGTLTGGLFINPANSAVIGLDAASDTFRLRSDSTQPFARQLVTTMGSGTLVKIQAAGYGAVYVTDLGFYTSSSSAVNTTPNLYLTGGDNRVGINTTTPAYTLDVVGTAGVSGVLTLGSTISNGTFTYTLPGATGTLALVGGAGVGTVTSVAALTLGTTGTDLSSTVANGTTTPVITLNVPTASAANRGALSAADWTTFNNKAPSVAGGYLPLSGGTLTGALSGTSATFSSFVDGLGLRAIGSSGFGSSGVGVEVGWSGSLGYVQAYNRSTSAYQPMKVDGSTLSFQTSGSEKLGIAATGAATFSSSVTANGNINASTASAALQANGYQVAKYSYFGYSLSYPGIIIGNTGGQSLFFNVDISGNLSGLFNGGGQEYVWRNAGSFITPNSSNNGYNTLFSWNSSGQLNIPNNFLIGTTTDAGYKLDVNGTGRFSGRLTISNTVDAYAEMTTSSAGGDALLGFSNTGDANSGWGIGRRSTGEFWIANYTGNFLTGTRTVPFQIASTGAATFSSSVTATGATLTGALSGTSATFGGTLWSNVARNNTVITAVDATNVANGFALLGYQSYWGIRTAIDYSFNLDIYNNGAPLTAFKITNSGGGAATFSSSVTANGVIYANDNIRVYAANQFWFNSGFRGQIVPYSAYGGGTDYSPFFTSETSLAFGVNGNATKALNIASTGAATFAGALSGTSALFSGTFEAGRTGGAVTAGDLSVDTTSLSANVYVGRLSSTSNDNTNFIVRNRVGGELFKVIGNTGAATFSSSVTAGGSITTNGNLANIRGGDTYLFFTENSVADKFLIGSSAGSNDLVFRSNAYNLSQGTERMRITSGGNVLIGTTTDAGYTLNVVGNAQIIKSTTSTALVVGLSGVTGSIIRFSYNGGFVGSISTDGTNTAYNTSSDYRLKEDLKSINGLDIVNKIKVYDYKWKSDGTRMDGVLAHELQEILPYAVFGQKDGKEMQGVDYSKIVPVMVQAIKDLKKELDTLKNK